MFVGLFFFTSRFSLEQIKHRNKLGGLSSIVEIEVHPNCFYSQ